MRARNVTLRGEEKCAMGVEECVLVVTNDCNDTSKTVEVTDQDVYKILRLVTESSHVTLENLKVVAGYNRARATTGLKFSILVQKASHIMFEHFESYKSYFNQNRSNRQCVHSCC